MQIYGLRDEDITEPSNYRMFMSKEVLVVFKNLTKRSPAILFPFLLHMWIKMICDFMQYLNKCGQAISPTMLNRDMILYFTKSFKSIRLEANWDIFFPKVKNRKNILCCIEGINNILHSFKNWCLQNTMGLPEPGTSDPRYTCTYI